METLAALDLVFRLGLQAPYVSIVIAHTNGLSLFRLAHRMTLVSTHFRRLDWFGVWGLMRLSGDIPCLEPSKPSYLSTDFGEVPRRG